MVPKQRLRARRTPMTRQGAKMAFFKIIAAAMFTMVAAASANAQSKPIIDTLNDESFSEEEKFKAYLHFCFVGKSQAFKQAFENVIDDEVRADSRRYVTRLAKHTYDVRTSVEPILLQDYEEASDEERAHLTAFCDARLKSDLIEKLEYAVNKAAMKAALAAQRDDNASTKE